MLHIVEDPDIIRVNAAPVADLYPIYLSDLPDTVTKRTRTTYRNQIRPVCLWWNEYGPPHKYIVTQRTFTHLRNWLRNTYRNRHGQPPAQNTMRTMMRRLRQFLRWLHVTGRSPVDMSIWVDLPAAKKPEPRILSPHEIEQLFEACEGNTRLRDMALLAFLLETGVRRVEAANAQWQNVEINFDTGIGTVYLEVVKGYKDFDKRRTVVFGPTTTRTLHVYAAATNAPSKGEIFGMTNSGIRFVMNKVSRISGIEFSAHDFRRTFATHWMRNCVTPSDSLAERLLELQLGHSPHTVAQRHYMALTPADVAHHYVSPLDDLDVLGMKRFQR